MTTVTGHYCDYCAVMTGHWDSLTKWLKRNALQSLSKREKYGNERY